MAICLEADLRAAPIAARHVCEQNTSPLQRLAEAAHAVGANNARLEVSDRAVEALLAAGATVRRFVYQKPDEAPYVLEVAELKLNGVTIEAQRPPRPATQTEVEVLETDEAFYHRDWFTSASLPAQRKGG